MDVPVAVTLCTDYPFPFAPSTRPLSPTKMTSQACGSAPVKPAETCTIEMKKREKRKNRVNKLHTCSLSCFVALKPGRRALSMDVLNGMRRVLNHMGQGVCNS